MIHLEHGIVNCTGFEIVERLPWDTPPAEATTAPAASAQGWGFLACRPPRSLAPGEYTGDVLYGALGPTQHTIVQEECLAIPLPDVPASTSALECFALACGLSVTDLCQLEFGDTVVVVGANPLSRSVLMAAKTRRARTACLLPAPEAAPAWHEIQGLADAVIGFEYSAAFEAQLDAFLAATRGSLVFVETAGQPDPVVFLAKRLTKFGKFVFCRQDSNAVVSMDLRSVHHLKSARFLYWGSPPTLREALALSDCYRRAANLYAWGRVEEIYR